MERNISVNGVLLLVQKQKRSNLTIYNIYKKKEARKMKGLKKIISSVLIVTMVLSVSIVTKKSTVKATAVVPFQVTSPTANKLLPAGTIKITWNNGNSYGTVKNYTVYIDGNKETTTTSTSYDFYTTKVNIHSVWVTAQMSDGKYMDTPTVKFKVSKKGVAANKGMAVELEPDDIQASWYYNWGTREFKQLSQCTTQKDKNEIGVNFADQFKKIEYVPMVWNSNSYADSLTKVQNAKNAGYKYILGFNEPDFRDQANMSVATAISCWPAFMNKGMKVGSPATGTWPTTNTWFQNFMSQVDSNGSLSVDFITIHCYPENYGGSAGANWFLTEVVDACWEKYHKPIWITEFAPQGQYITKSSMTEFIKTALQGLDSRDYVERYSAFSFDGAGTDNTTMNSALWYHSTGAFTDAGRAYCQYGNPTEEYVAGTAVNLNRKLAIKVNVPQKPVAAKPAKAKIKSVKNIKTRKIKLTLNKTKNAKGYQIKICDNKKFSGYWTKNITKTTYTFKKMDKKTTYYFKVRAYTKKGSTKIYGAWSNTKKVKVKK